MLNEPQIEKLLEKIKRFQERLEPMIFDTYETIDFSQFVTKERLHEIPDDSKFAPAERGTTWYGKDAYSWYKSTFTVPAELAGKK